jgi:hypothetical protein
MVHRAPGGTPTPLLKATVPTTMAVVWNVREHGISKRVVSEAHRYSGESRKIAEVFVDLHGRLNRSKGDIVNMLMAEHLI